MQRESEREAAKGEIQTLKEAILMRKAENERELRRRERLEKEAKDIKTVRAQHTAAAAAHHEPLLLLCHISTPAGLL